ncbi:MAG: hypothetical protein WC455_30475 [Dehalococcoidia bacterium]|jgi:hypothetical protein
MKARAKGKKDSKRTTSVNINKKKMLEALEKSMGIVTQAAELSGLDRGAHYKWMGNDPNYAIAVKDLENVSLDFAESKLFKEIEARNITAIIFYLKCKGKKRGYIDHVENEQTQNPEKMYDACMAVADAMRVK